MSRKSSKAASALRRRGPHISTADPSAPRKIRKLSPKDAFAYIRKQATGRCELPFETFQLYVAYKIVPAVVDQGKQKLCPTELDRFLIRAPDGVYANHLDYETASARTEKDVSMKEAYAFYQDIDPHPLTASEFREVVKAGILPAIRTSDNPKAPLVGIKKQSIFRFLALRQRLQEDAVKTQAHSLARELNGLTRQKASIC